MNPNHYLAAAISYLYSGARPGWRPDAGIGKTLVSSSLIDRVGGELGRKVIEVPVGFKWFVPGLLSGDVGFGGEESAGASFLRTDGTAWTTDKDGPIMCLLASEIIAKTGKSPSELHAALVERLGESWYARVDAAATPAEKAALGKLSPEQVPATTLAGGTITAKLTTAPGNGAAIGGSRSRPRTHGSRLARPAPRTCTRSTRSRSCLRRTSRRCRSRPGRLSRRHWRARPRPTGAQRLYGRASLSRGHTRATLFP